MTAHDEAVKAAAVRMYGGRRWEALTDEQRTYWLTMAEAAVAAAVPALLAAEHHGRHACCAVAERHRAEGAAAERQRIAEAIRAECIAAEHFVWSGKARVCGHCYDDAARIAEAGP